MLARYNGAVYAGKGRNGRLGPGVQEREAFVAVANGEAMNRLLAVIARLRGEGGCPWDRKQTLDSLKPYLVEECYELLEAIDGGDPAAHRDELGDVLLQVLLQSRIRAEEGEFDFEAVAAHLTEKLIRRHPHVFGDSVADTPEEVVLRWAEIKRQERGGVDAPPQATLDGIPRQLPALHRAQRIQERAARVGFDWSRIDDVLDKVEEELGEVREALASGSAEAVEDELGDLLFATVNLCRFRGIHAEEALRWAIGKFTGRFHEVERRILGSGRRLEDCTLDEMDREWDLVKAEGR
jgi:MazG family protein